MPPATPSPYPSSKPSTSHPNLSSFGVFITVGTLSFFAISATIIVLWLRKERRDLEKDVDYDRQVRAIATAQDMQESRFSKLGAGSRRANMKHDRAPKSPKAALNGVHRSLLPVVSGPRASSLTPIYKSALSWPSPPRPARHRSDYSYLDQKLEVDLLSKSSVTHPEATSIESYLTTVLSYQAPPAIISTTRGI